MQKIHKLLIIEERKKMPMGDYKDFDDCVSKNRDKEDPKAYCGSIKKKVEKMSSDSQTVTLSESYMTLSSNGEKDGKLWIEGVALREGKHNLFYYPNEEILKSQELLTGVTIRRDHGKSVKDVVGKVTESHIGQEGELRFRGWVDYDETLKKKISDGIIDNVSVGVNVTPYRNKTEKRLEAHNLRYKELSLVTLGACNPKKGCGIGLSDTDYKVVINTALSIISSSKVPEFLTLYNLFMDYLTVNLSEKFTNCLLTRTDLYDEPKEVYENMFKLLSLSTQKGIEINDDVYYALWGYFSELNDIISDWDTEIVEMLEVLDYLNNQELFTECEARYIVGGQAGTRYKQGWDGCMLAKKKCAGLSHKRAMNLCTLIFFRKGGKYAS